jgi:hypothetical protein
MRVSGRLRVPPLLPPIPGPRARGSATPCSVGGGILSCGEPRKDISKASVTTTSLGTRLQMDLLIVSRLGTALEACGAFDQRAVLAGEHPGSRLLDGAPDLVWRDRRDSAEKRVPRDAGLGCGPPAAAVPGRRDIGDQFLALRDAHSGWWGYGDAGFGPRAGVRLASVRDAPPNPRLLRKL